MAYVDYEFYKEKYFGDTVPEDGFPKCAERAKDFLDAITFGRLINDYPTNEDFDIRIKKANCAVAERFYLLNLAEQMAIDAVKNGIASAGSETSENSGAVKSRSAGSESISYETTAEKLGYSKSWNSVFAAAGDEDAENKLLFDAAKQYLMGVFTDSGVPVLFSGVA